MKIIMSMVAAGLLTATAVGKDLHLDKPDNPSKLSCLINSRKVRT